MLVIFGCCGNLLYVLCSTLLILSLWAFVSYVLCLFTEISRFSNFRTVMGKPNGSEILRREGPYAGCPESKYSGPCNLISDRWTVSTPPPTNQVWRGVGNGFKPQCWAKALNRAAKRARDLDNASWLFVSSQSEPNWAQSALWPCSDLPLWRFSRFHAPPEVWTKCNSVW